MAVPGVAFSSIIPYSKQKSTYTCCLCEVHSVPKEKSCQYKQLFHHRYNLVASARLAEHEELFTGLPCRNCKSQRVSSHPLQG